jgi:inhibitor of cysteine peptidase
MTGLLPGAMMGMEVVVMRWLDVAMVVVVAFAGGCGGGARVMLTEEDSPTEVPVGPGDEIEIRLESNATTGYRWVLPDDRVPEPVALVESRFEEPDSDLVGAPGTQVFVFEVVGAGADVLRLEYIRPFDDPPIPERVVEYVVIVDGAEWPPTDVSPPGTSEATAP